MRLVLLLAVICTACVIPTKRGLSAQRSRVWVAPGSPMVFSWVSTVEHRENRELDLGKDDAEVVHTSDDDTVRTAIYAVDPATQQEVRLGQLEGEGGTPVYYDAPRDILWVRGKDRELVGLTRSGEAATGPQHQRQLDVPVLEPPFVLAGDKLGVVALHDLRHDGSIPLTGLDNSEISVSGDLVRFTELSRLDDSVRVRQIAVDWSSGHPQRLPDLDWTTSPLPPTAGLRVAIAMMSDGRRYAEVIRDATGTRLLIYDLTSMSPVPTQIALPAPGSENPTKPHLVALAGDALVFGEELESGDDRCWRGAIVRVDRNLVAPIPYDPCVIEARDAGPHRVLIVKDVGTAVVGPDAKIVALTGVEAKNVADGIATGPTTRVFATDDGELQQVDLATGELKELGRGEAKDHLLAIDGNSVRYARGGDKVVTVSFDKAGSPSVVALGEPTLARGDRMPLDRTEFWLGVNGGVGTNGTGAGGLNAEIAHWVSDHWTWVVRGGARFTADASDAKKQYFDGGASFGYAWHRLPRLFSLSLEGDVGANFAGTYVDETRTDAAFAPSLELHIGWQGKMVGLDVSSVLPSMIDIDRGVLFLLNAKIGFTENLH
jgi:hypothetical protein